MDTIIYDVAGIVIMVAGSTLVYFGWITRDDQYLSGEDKDLWDIHDSQHPD